MTLSQETRDAIGRSVRSLRSLFEEEFAKQASGRFGIRSTSRNDVANVDSLDACLDPLESLSLTPAEFAQRDELVHALRYLNAEGLAGSEAVARLIREAAFTAVNRLLAVRVAEAIGALPPVLAKGRQSAGYRDTVADLFPALATDEHGYWIYLQVAGDELAPGVPRLFDRRHPTSAFVPSRACVDEALALLAAAELDTAWVEPETLGWGYQFFNGGDVKEMRDQSPSHPRTSRELAVRNQFFTPRYVVDWLVQNTLGRRLIQAGHEVDLPLLVGEVGDSAPLALEDVRVLDPAVGSGHFLLGSYDLLEQAWHATGVASADAADKILPCLFGVDIDPRAAQVAQAVLLLRARRSAPAAELDPPMIITAVALPQNQALREEAFAGLSPAARHLADEVADALDRAPVLGSLLKVEQRLEAELAASQSAPRITHDADQESLLADMHQGLDRLVSTSATPEQRMFTADASDALGLLEICQQRYDAVLMNPPFGAPIPETKSYLKAAYDSAAVDLYAAFVSRGAELLRAHGQVGAITNRTGFFLKSFSGWRRQTLAPHLVCMAHLGFGVLHEALVEAAAYVLSRTRESASISFRSMLRERDKGSLAIPNAGRTWIRERSIFSTLPNGSISYWVADSIVKVFANEKAIKEIGDVRQGLATADDFRFVRLLWEVSPGSVGSDLQWSPFAKGGAYAPFHSDLHLVVDWENDGERLRNFERAYIRNPDAYFQPALTWSLRTASALAVRPLPAGAVFSHKGCFLSTPDNAAGLAWANSSPVRYLIELQLAAGETTSSGGAARSYEVGVLAGLPYPQPMPARIGELGRALAEERALHARHVETSPHFASPSTASRSGLENADAVLEMCAEVDTLVIEAFDLDADAVQAIREETGPAVARYPRDTAVDPTEVRRLFALPIKRLVDHALEAHGGARYLAMKTHMVDRRLEILCHLFAAHPAVILDALDGAMPSTANRDHARQVVSYIVGVAFGRWDCRLYGQDAAPVDPWAPLPASPPAMLIDDAGQPSRTGGGSYPLPTPSEPLLVDDSGTRWDIGGRVEAVATELKIDVDALVRDLAVASLGDYLRRQFSADHLAMYSMSRRKSPLYWQLGVPSRDWSVWLYYPELSREALFGVARVANEKAQQASELAGRLSGELARSAGQRDLRTRYESADKLAHELSLFGAEIENVAQSGWNPDLNDGAVLNAAPLAELLLDTAWRREAMAQRKKLIRGAYPWAAVQQQLYGGRE